MTIKINLMELNKKKAQTEVGLDLAYCSKPSFTYGAK